MMYREWERLATLPGGHNKIVANLREIVKLKGQKGYPRLVPFNDDLRRDLWIASKHTVKKEFHYIAYIPDLIITIGEKPEDRIFIEYVNTEGRNSENFLRCLRGMRALECVIRIRKLGSRKFVLALRDNFARNYFSRAVPRDSMLDIMPLSLLLKRLEGEREWDCKNF